MRVRHTKAAVAAGLTLFLVSISCFAAPPVSQIVQYHLATRDFSELYAAIRAGQYDPFDQQDLVRSILGTGPGMTAREKEALLEQLFIRVNDGGVAEDRVRSVTAVLLERFAMLETPTLRARVLRRAGELGAAGTEQAVLQSAESLSAMLAGHADLVVVEGYELEATTLAAVAPGYPSTALAELLRIIAMHSTDRRVVTASRDAARQILLAQ